MICENDWLFIKEVDMKRVLDSLPSIDQTSAVVGIVYALSEYSEVEVCI